MSENQYPTFLNTTSSQFSAYSIPSKFLDKYPLIFFTFFICSFVICVTSEPKFKLSFTSLNNAISVNGTTSSSAGSTLNSVAGVDNSSPLFVVICATIVTLPTSSGRIEYPIG